MVTMLPLPFPDDAFGHRPEPRTPGLDADTRIATMLKERLGLEHGDATRDVAVVVQNRVIILSGSVLSSTTARQIGELAWETPGVYDVCNCLAWS
jgi:osmotically-inducible protein OsmY